MLETELIEVFKRQIEIIKEMENKDKNDIDLDENENEKEIDLSIIESQNDMTEDESTLNERIMNVNVPPIRLPSPTKSESAGIPTFGRQTSNIIETGCETPNVSGNRTNRTRARIAQISPFRVTPRSEGSENMMIAVFKTQADISKQEQQQMTPKQLKAAEKELNETKKSDDNSNSNNKKQVPFSADSIHNKSFNDILGSTNESNEINETKTDELQQIKTMDARSSNSSKNIVSESAITSQSHEFDTAKSSNNSSSNHSSSGAIKVEKRQSIRFSLSSASYANSNQTNAFNNNSNSNFIGGNTNNSNNNNTIPKSASELMSQLKGFVRKRVIGTKSANFNSGAMGNESNTDAMSQNRLETPSATITNSATPFPSEKGTNKGIDAFTSETSKNSLVSTLRARVINRKERIEWEHPCLRIYAMYELRGAVFGTKDYFYIVQSESVGRTNMKLRYNIPMTVENMQKEEINGRVSDFSQIVNNSNGLNHCNDGQLSGIPTIEHYKIRWKDIINVYKRHYIHQPMGLEVFCRQSLQFFLVLHDDARKHVFETILTKSKLKHSFSLHFIEPSMKHSLCIEEIHNTGRSSGKKLNSGGSSSIVDNSDISSSSNQKKRKHFTNTSNETSCVLCPCLSYNNIYFSNTNTTKSDHKKVGNMKGSNSNQLRKHNNNISNNNSGKIKNKWAQKRRKRGINRSNKYDSCKALHCAQSLWLQGLLPNFDYIMILNHIAGRSFNDVTQYPVFPWILADYESKELDYNSPLIYRDLSKPMGALDPIRAGKYMEQFNEWEGRLSISRNNNHCNDSIGAGGSSGGDGDYGRNSSGGSYDINTLFAYHYGTHYSNPASVFHYLLRLHPYTQSHCELQNGKFDHPDRLFHNVRETWTHQSSKSLHAVRELIPEFYYLANFLKNGANHEFGVRESDRSKINNVILPDWAYNDENVFIEKHRFV